MWVSTLATIPICYRNHQQAWEPVALVWDLGHLYLWNVFGWGCNCRNCSWKYWNCFLEVLVVFLTCLWHFIATFITDLSNWDFLHLQGRVCMFVSLQDTMFLRTPFCLGHNVSQGTFLFRTQCFSRHLAVQDTVFLRTSFCFGHSYLSIFLVREVSLYCKKSLTTAIDICQLYMIQVSYELWYH